MRTSDDLVLNVMPLDERVLGFSNRWYPLALDTATAVALAPDITIRAISAPAFLATKWQAFRERGADDPFLSHDLEDIITVVAGRQSVTAEVAASADEARQFIAEATRTFLAIRGPTKSSRVVSRMHFGSPVLPTTWSLGYARSPRSDYATSVRAPALS